MANDSYGRGKIYLKRFSLPSDDAEASFWYSRSERTLLNCYDSSYPFGVFRGRGLPELEFAPVTIIYGGNGSGKSTILNVIAERLRLGHSTVYNRSDFFEDYLRMCRSSGDAPPGSRLITSDEVFDCMFSLREENVRIEQERIRLLDEHKDLKYTPYRLKDIENIEELRRYNDAKRKTKSRFVRERAGESREVLSNGESALRFFSEMVTENALFLLDEPENSLSAGFQLELKEFLEGSARHFGCQLIIATHSPFLLAMPGAKIYDLDAPAICERKWTELENVRLFFEFFNEHRNEFE